MVKPNEAAGNQWDELDFENNLWNIPAERMKSKKPNFVPLTQQALSLLNVMKPISARSVYVFPSDRSLRNQTNASTANMALKRMGFGNQLVARGL
jgi:integrase